MGRTAKAVELLAEHFKFIGAWAEAKNTMDASKAAEMERRLNVVKNLPWSKKEKGSQTIPLGNGWRLKLVKTLTFSIDREVPNNDVCAMLNELSKTNPDAAANLIRWQPILSDTAYKMLTEEERKLASKIITSKPGTPQLELIEPAEAKG